MLEYFDNIDNETAKRISQRMRKCIAKETFDKQSDLAMTSFGVMNAFTQTPVSTSDMGIQYDGPLVGPMTNGPGPGPMRDVQTQSFPFETTSTETQTSNAPAPIPGFNYLSQGTQAQPQTTEMETQIYDDRVSIGTSPLEFLPTFEEFEMDTAGPVSFERNVQTDPMEPLIYRPVMSDSWTQTAKDEIPDLMDTDTDTDFTSVGTAPVAGPSRGPASPPLGYTSSGKRRRKVLPTRAPTSAQRFREANQTPQYTIIPNNFFFQ